MSGIGKAVENGEAPLGAQTPEGYLVRGGGVIAPADTDFDSVMCQRFGDILGRVSPDPAPTHS